MKAGAKIVGFHLLGWILFFGLIIAFVASFSVERSIADVMAPGFFLFMIIYIGLFYANAHVLLPNFYLKKRYVFYFGCMLVLLAAIAFFKPFERLVLHGDGGGPGPRNDMQGMRPPFDEFRPRGPRRGMNGNRGGPRFDLVSIVLFFAVWSASAVLEILKLWRRTERRAMQAEADKVAAELSFLKAQINPHFLFNTLNNIYSLATVKSEHTPNAILKLSGILRYITDDVRHDFVPLKLEIDCVQNYIELQKLRLSKKVTTVFSVEGNIETKQIPPLLFMTFIENAFKYGISNHEESTIRVNIKADEEKINLYCCNKIIRQTEEDREGVGISNAKKRLAYLYPQKHLLSIHTENNEFIVDLSILT